MVIADGSPGSIRPTYAQNPGAAALPLAGGVPLDVDVSVPEQELRRALLGVYGVVVGI